MFSTVIMAPGERIKCLLQVQQSAATAKYSGPVDVVKQVYKEGGIRSIYRGTAATLMRGKNAHTYFVSHCEDTKFSFSIVNTKKMEIVCTSLSTDGSTLMLIILLSLYCWQYSVLLAILCTVDNFHSNHVLLKKHDENKKH